MSQIKTAVVGLEMGAAHAWAYHLSDKSELRWVVDLDIEKAEKLAAQLNCRATTDWKEAMADVDAISFATPHHLHYPMALEAMEAGKHVLVEKPLANTEAECLELIKVAEEKKLVLMLAYIVRFRPAIVKIEEIIKSGKYGRPINIQGWVQGFLQPRPDQWFAKKDKLGGGVLFSHGCHYVDVMIAIMGKPVRATGLGTRVGTEWMEGEGTSHAIIEFENGALGEITSSWGMKYQAAPALYHIHTTEACLIVNFDKIEAITENGRETIYENTEPPIPHGSALGECEHFLDCIAEGKTPLTDGHAALLSHRTIWAIYNQNGVPVEL
jgi:predicted dehydrogenase